MTTETNSTPNPLRKIDYAGVGICVALTVLVYASGLAPLIERKAESVKRRSELNEKRDLARKTVTSLTSLKRELANVEQRLAASPLQLKPVSAVNQRIADLTELAVSVGATYWATAASLRATPVTGGFNPCAAVTALPISVIKHRVADATQRTTSFGVKLDEIHTGAGKHGDHYDTIPITISGAGTYRAGAIFLRRLHESYPDIGVTGFELAGNPASPTEPARLKLELSWFAAPIDR